MRIMQVTAHFPPDFSSGGANVPHELASGLAAMGHEVSVFAGCLNGLAPCAEKDEAAPEGFRIRWIGNSSFLSWADHKNYNNPKIAVAFGRYLDEVRPEIVHFHSIQTLGGSLLREAASRGCKVVVTMHDFWWFCARQFLVDQENRACSCVPSCGVCECSVSPQWRAAREEWLGHYLRYADRVLVPSEPMRKAVIANGVDSAKVRVNENGIEMENRSASRSQGPVRFMYAGGDSDIKGYGVLREALTHATVPQGTVLDLFNTSDDGFPAWARSCPAYSAENRDEVFDSHDVLIIPSIAKESHSIVTREALLAGLAVICSDSLGPEEVVHDGVNGQVVPTGDPVALRAAIERFSHREVLEDLTREDSLDFPTKDDQLAELAGYYEALVGGSCVAGTGATSTASSATPAAPLDQVGSAAESMVGNVLYVTGIQGAPARYRAWLPVEALAKVGIRGKVLHYRDPRLPEYAAQADAVVFYRVPATRQILELIDSIRAFDRTVPILGDVDDLIFDPSIEGKLDNLRTLSAEERDLWRRGIYRYRTTLDHCDFFIGSTPALSRAGTEILGVASHTFLNGVGQKLAQASDAALGAREPHDGVRIGFFSGTSTHDADWEFIEPVLAEILENHEDTELWLGGLVEPSAALEKYAARIVRIPFKPWHELPAALADIDICLAPLTPGSEFNESKSAIKWLEAALVDVPCVCANTEPFRDSIEDGVTGFLAETREDWHRAIVALLEDPALRSSMGAKAHRQVMFELAPAIQAERLRAILGQAWLQVFENGHKPAFGHEVVEDDEPFSTYESALEPYALPTEGTAGEKRRPQAVDKLIRSYRADGLTGTARRVARKMKAVITRG